LRRSAAVWRAPGLPPPRRGDEHRLGRADTRATPQWTLLGTAAGNGGIDVYVAPASLRRSGDTARMLNLFDFKTRQVYAGKPFLSARNEYEFDCARSRQRILASTGFSGHMGKGTVVVSSEGDGVWQSVGAGGPSYQHWAVACRR
jgi:hypothetical protein